MTHRSIPTKNSTLYSLSDPYANLDGKDGQYLINVELQIIPGQEHTETLFQKTKDLLQYIQRADPTAEFLSRTTLPDGKPHPSLTSPNDKNWPTTFLAAQNWIHTSMEYLFKLPPVSEKQLQADPSTKGPVSIYATLRLRTSIPRFDSLLDSVNIDLRKLNIKVSQKTLQSWDSKPRKILCSVNGSLCVAGVQQLLLHQLKEMEKKLCRHGKRDMLEWYDKPLPELTVSLRGLRPLRLPREENERKSLSFDSFPWDSKLVFYLEAEEDAWQRLGPLFDYLEETNIIAHTFGPAAYLLDVPSNNPTTEKVRAYQKHGRISIGYSLATTVLECSDVQIYDHDVKVGMEEVDEVDEKGIPTGRRIKPKPPYARTNLRKELHFPHSSDDLQRA
jgi:hypothetical protein